MTMKIDLHYKDTFKFIETIDHFCQISVDRKVSIITKQKSLNKQIKNCVFAVRFISGSFVMYLNNVMNFWSLFSL